MKMYNLLTAITMQSQMSTVKFVQKIDVDLQHNGVLCVDILMKKLFQFSLINDIFCVDVFMQKIDDMLIYIILSSAWIDHKLVDI